MRPQAEPSRVQEVVGHAVWIRQCDEVTAGHNIRLEAETIARDSALEIEREEPVSLASEYPDRYGWPIHEVARRPEDGVGLWPLMRFSRSRHLWWNVVQKVRVQVELSAVATGHGGALARVEPARVIPPCSRGLARVGDHRVHENKLSDGNSSAYHGGSEPTERLRDEHHVTALPDCRDNQACVFGQTGVFVVAGQVDRNDLV